MQKKIRLFDIAANLCDDQFSGIYHGKQKHDADAQIVIDRARQYGVDRLLLSAGCYSDTIKSQELIEKNKGCYTTVGIHPCRANVV